MCCRLSELCPAPRHPLLGQEGAERRRGTADRYDRCRRSFERRCDRFGIGAASAGGMPAASFASCEGVDAVVVDDVEAAVAFDDVGHAGGIGSRPVRDQPEDHAAMSRVDRSGVGVEVSLHDSERFQGGASVLGISEMDVGGLGEHQPVWTALSDRGVGDGQFGFVDALVEVLSAGLRQRPGGLLGRRVGEERCENAAVRTASG